MGIQFTKATKKSAKLRLALIGVSGSGKTFSALSIARGLGSKIAVIDTEHGSAAKYADQFAFDVLNLDDFDPARYIEAIEAAEGAGYDVVILDSLSHAWSGTGGILEQKDRAGSGFDAWRKLTPKHNALVDAIIRSRVHVIATMRAKQEYAVEINERGKAAPKKLGMGAVQRDGMEYEFDVVGMLDEAALNITKTRYPKIAWKLIQRPGESFGRELAAWLSDGSPAAPAPQPVAPPPPALVEAVRQTPPDAPLVVPSEPVSATPSGPEQVAAGLVDLIAKADTIAALESQVLPQIQAAKLVDAPRKTVADAYAARRRALNGVRS